MLLTDRTAVVTGAGSGIGREIALLFAAEGARIAALDRSQEAGEAVVEELVAVGGAGAGVRSRGRPLRRRRRGGDRARGRDDGADRHPRQLRRRPRDRRRLHDAGGGVGERDRDQPQRHVLLLPVGGPQDARERRRLDRQPRLGGRADRALAPSGVLGHEARDRGPDEEPRAGSRAGGDSRQRTLPRRDPDADDGAVLLRRQLRAGARGLRAARALRRDERRGAGRSLSSRATWRRTSPASRCRSTAAGWRRRASSRAAGGRRSSPDARRARTSRVASGQEREEAGG